MPKEPASPVTTLPIAPEVLSLRVPDSPLVAQAKALKIQTDDDVITAKELRGQLKARITFVMDDPAGPMFTANTNAAHKLHKSLVAAAAVFTVPCKDAIDIIDRGIGSHELKKRQEKEAADKKAAEDQAAERLKIMQAAQAKIDRAMKSTGKIETQIEEMQKIVDDLLATEDARTLAARQIEVLRLQLENKQEAAAQIQKTAEQAMDALPVASPASMDYVKTKGVRDTMSIEVLDKLALIKLVAEGKAPENILEIDEGKLKAVIKVGVKFPANVVKVTQSAVYGGRG